MRFSVVICTHNRCRVLPRALEAVGRLEVPVEWAWELIVVDNASDDDTPGVVKDFAARAPMPVRYVHEGRLGHSAALNAGVKACQGEIIAFTDDDGLPHPDWLVQIERAFGEYDAQCVFGRAVPVWEKAAPRWFSPRFNKYFALLDYGPRPFVVADMRTPFYGVNHAWRQEALLALGGYREDLGLYGNRGGVGNDLDLLERALAAGLRAVYNPDACVRHIIPAERCGKAHQRRKVWVGTGFHYEFLRDNPPEAPWLLGLPRYFFRFALGDLRAYGKAVFTRNRADAFYHELQLIRFAGLLYAARAGFRRKPRSAGPRPAAHSV
jgi:glycosyltransferase involved in cell wall biosynthesis